MEDRHWRGANGNAFSSERIDMLLAEAQQMKVDVETLMTLIRQRSARIEEPSR